MKYIGRKPHLLRELKSRISNDVNIVDASSFDQSIVSSAIGQLSDVPTVTLVSTLGGHSNPTEGSYDKAVLKNVAELRKTISRLIVMAVPRCPQDWRTDFSYAVEHSVLCMATGVSEIPLVAPSKLAEAVASLNFSGSLETIALPGTIVDLSGVTSALSRGAGKEIVLERTDPLDHLELISPFVDHTIARDVVQAHVIATAPMSTISSPVLDTGSTDSGAERNLLNIIENMAKEELSAK